MFRHHPQKKTIKTKVSFAQRQSPPCIARAIIFLVLGILCFAAFLDYDPSQSYFITTAAAYNRVVAGSIKPNAVGKWGTGMVFYNLFYFGCTCWLIPGFFMLLTYMYACKLAHLVRWWKFFLMLAALIAGCGLWTLIESHYISTVCETNYFPKGLGGVAGKLLFQDWLSPNLGVFGSGLLLSSLWAISIICVFIPTPNPFVTFRYFINNTTIICGSFLSILLGKLKNVGSVARGHIHVPKFKFPQFSLPKFSFRSKDTTQVAEDSNIHTLLLENASSVATLATNKPADISKLSGVLPSVTAEHPIVPKIPVFQETVSTSKISNDYLVETVDEDFEDDIDIDSLKSIDSDIDIKVVAEEKIEKASAALISKKVGYRFPSIELLEAPSCKTESQNEDYGATAKALVYTLKEFGIEVTPGEVHQGPVITRYEIIPASGVRVEKIASLDKNIAMALQAISVRIMAPVPGKGCVGIEVPNKFPLPVCLRDIIESTAFAQSKAEIPIVLGKEVTGKPLVADLTKMPHLLIAGSTGAGKTVCINAIIVSLLYHSTPEDVRFIMVDPKIVEMQVYNELPHLMIPVVTDPKKVPNALKWLIKEMEGRYQLFAKVGVRNVASFNQKLPTIQNIEIPLEYRPKMPYIVCIIDELADLMMVAPADIETSIARLAQLARAAGIHLIIATQRPSVNVITGVIKANLPCRISFKVASKIDSRTILDAGGADQLIGRGDMLFTPPGSSDLMRAQGAFVSDEETYAIIEAVKQNGPPDYRLEMQQQIENDDDAKGDKGSEYSDVIPLFPKVLDIFQTTKKVSASILITKLVIGYPKATRIMMALEELGYISPANGSKPRQVLKDTVDADY